MNRMKPKYQLTETNNAFHKNHWCVQILDGDFQGVVYQYDTLKVDTEKDEIRFNTITVENPDDLDLESAEFIDVMSEILDDILQEKYRENGNDDSPKSPEQ